MKRQFLIDARRNKGWSQTKAAKILETSQQTISDHENGFPVKPDMAFKYIEVYEMEDIKLEDFYR